MPITPTPHIWMNGEMVPWEDAKIHVLTHTLHYGTGAVSYTHLTLPTKRNV